ncbi:LPS assembly protein LptD [Echinimonas agarilytica]|uniref:LPS-assembly protein LptD n=1 Tax=Echinimonas agarilytica TaxID=1215918 RepID=A0AA42B8V6_9GAMM|nr:LPS assembly protein LptD [Echinimonas agarilytica]MCM2681292.1 LPS assembly protein LptD [Echinimonas agarilytica]
MPLTISADKAAGEHNTRLEFTGDVSVTQGTKSLTAQQAILNQDQSQLDASGDVHYEDPIFMVDSDGLNANAETGVVEMTNSTYSMKTDGSRGKAKTLKIVQREQKFILKDGTFTTCPEGDDSWLMEADEIELDGESEWGEAHSSTIRLMGVPVLWVPYMTFPISDKRKTGLLFPTISNSSTNGLDLSQPYYWNFREDADATFTPRYMANRGTQISTEVRYLREEQYNQLNFEFLGSDKELANSDDRYLTHWLHQGKFTENWRSFVEYTHVSDDNYFNDLGSDVGNETDNRLERTAQLTYVSESFDSNLTVTDFEVFGNTSDVYRQLPRIDFTYRVPYLSDVIDMDIYAEATRFDHQDDDQVTANRYHIEPSIRYGVHKPSNSFELEAKLYQSYYDQDDPSDTLDSSVSRTIPSFRAYGQLNFERSTSWFGSRFTQTLEPKAQYLYIDYENQDEIGVYDTVAMRDDVYSLFRDRRFSSIDRISDANQLTLGVTTRMLNEQNQETFNLSMGQIIYLSDSEMLEDLSGIESENASAFAMSMDAYMGDFDVRAEYQYDFERDMTQTSSLLLNYSPSARKLAQVSYHYSPEPIVFGRSFDVEPETREINQLGLVASWPISEKYQLVGTHYRDTDLGRSIESLVGIQYQSCCWAIRLVYQRNLNTNFPDDGDSFREREAYDAGIAIQFEIKGFGGSSDMSGHQSMIDKSLFGYRRNYYLNN